MRIHLSILALALVSSTIAAQTTYQSWDLYPGVTSFTSRGNIGSGSGEALQGVHNSTNRGVMDVGGKCVISQVYTITQDQNCATTEKFSWVVRGGSDVVGPDVSPTAVIGTVSGLSLPNSTTNGACAWGLTTTLTGTAAIAVPCDRHWSYGLRLPPSPNWSSDGQSIHASASTAQNAHATAEDQAWQILGAAGVATHPSSKRSWRLTTRVADGVVFELGCGGAYGMGGSFPVASTASTALAWDARVSGGTAMAGATPIAVIGTSRMAGGLSFGTGANLYLNGPYLVLFGAAASSAGVGNVPILPFVPASASGAGWFHLQGAMSTTSSIRLANSQSVIP